MKREIDLQELVTWLCGEAELDISEFYSSGEREYVIPVTSVFAKVKELAKLTEEELGELVHSGEVERIKLAKQRKRKS